MRTIGIEGRCFVVTSNMCVREGAKHVSQKPRRNSCITEEGFEIALPPSPSAKKGTGASANPLAGHGAGSAARARRRSVFDEDGNEIVLGGPPPTHHKTAIPAPPSTTSAVIEEDEEENVERKGGIAADYLSRGGSSIVSPFGEVLAGPQWEDDEGIIYADVDLEDCVRGRLDLDAAGSYSRFVLPLLIFLFQYSLLLANSLLGFLMPDLISYDTFRFAVGRTHIPANHSAETIPSNSPSKAWIWIPCPTMRRRRRGPRSRITAHENVNCKYSI